MPRTGRPRAIQPEHEALLRDIVKQQPEATLAQIAQRLQAAGGPSVSLLTLGKTLRRCGYRRVAPPIVSTPGPKRYGYTSQHRPPAGKGSPYPSSLTDAEWALVADLFTAKTGRPVLHDRRLMLDACCYILRTGAPWRYLPKDFPHWSVVLKTFRRWVLAGRFEKMQERLRQQWRQRMGRPPDPSTVIIDSQSTRSSPQGGTQGYDAGKKTKGRKRHILVDSLGLVVALVITGAHVHDSVAAQTLMQQACAKTCTIKHLYADSSYGGRCAKAIAKQHNIEVHIVRRCQRLPADEPDLPAQSFGAQPKRWIVERTHAWNEKCRRLVMHHDRTDSSSAAWIWLRQTCQLVRRPAPPAWAV
ncbi:IS5 family transposase [Xylophilus rhododendri]|uniref:IS5 family transposase n=1 Tax=Xylophilus rhododendri TaxID=2697032 RepID=A0A857J683_9BURK|nr:IS5 family transposase [Xylophilus rhododendri]QHI99504.1 IS5 family transposase [Xylophilus rhododendri]